MRTICGREAHEHYQCKAAMRDFVRPRIVVKGINHPKGQPIRFKSVANAERHIRNHRLHKD